MKWVSYTRSISSRIGEENPSTLYRKVYADTGKGKARIGGSGDCFRDGISESSEKVGIYEVAFEKKGPKKNKSALQKNL